MYLSIYQNWYGLQTTIKVSSCWLSWFICLVSGLDLVCFSHSATVKLTRSLMYVWFHYTCKCTRLYQHLEKCRLVTVWYIFCQMFRINTHSSLMTLTYGMFFSPKSYQHWNGNVFILMKFSSLAALEVVKMTTSSAARDENFIKMTFLFQWMFFV